MTTEPAVHLEFQRTVYGQTVLAERRVRYPFSVQAPLPDHPDRPNGTQVMVQSTAGGIFSGDDIALAFMMGRGAQARVRMPAATVVHSMQAGRHARHRIRLNGELGSLTEFLPLPLLMFPNSRLRQQTCLTIGAGARMLVQEGFACHDPSDKGGLFEWLDSELRVCHSDGTLIALDRSLVTGEAIRAAYPGVTGACRSAASMWLLRTIEPEEAKSCCCALQAWLEDAHLFGGVTPLRQDKGIMVRVLAKDGGALLSVQDSLARLMRKMLNA